MRPEDSGGADFRCSPKVGNSCLAPGNGPAKPGLRRRRTKAPLLSGFHPAISHGVQVVPRPHGDPVSEPQSRAPPVLQLVIVGQFLCGFVPG